MTRMMRVNSVEKLFEHAAAMIERSARALLSGQETVVLALPGGRSAAGIFQNLRKRRIKWKKVHIFMVDERLVSVDHADSNFRLVRENLTDELIEKGRLPEANVHPFIYDAEQADHGTGKYEDELKRFGGRYDIILLSSGEDGHIGALYPKHHSIKDDAEFFITMDDSPKPPPLRMSMSRKLVLRSRVAIAVFAGNQKKDALDMFRSVRHNFFSCPVKLIHDIRDSYVITDIGDDKR